MLQKWQYTKHVDNESCAPKFKRHILQCKKIGKIWLIFYIDFENPKSWSDFKSGVDLPKTLYSKKANMPSLWEHRVAEHTKINSKSWKNFTIHQFEKVSIHQLTNASKGGTLEFLLFWNKSKFLSRYCLLSKPADLGYLKGVFIWRIGHNKANSHPAIFFNQRILMRF